MQKNLKVSALIQKRKKNLEMAGVSFLTQMIVVLLG